MANVTNASTEDIYERLVDTNGYHPFEANTFAPWTLEAGDMVKMKRGTEEYDSPVHTTRMVWKGTPTMQVNSTGNKERESVSKVGKKKYGRGGAGMRTQQGFYYDLYSEDGTLHSSLIMTASILRTEFDAANSTLYSVIEQTATYIRSEVADVQSGMYSRIEQTASQIRSEVASTSTDLNRSIITQTSTMIRSEVISASSEISHSVITQTSSMIKLEVGDAVSGIYGSVIEQTASYIRSEVRGAASSIAHTVIEQTEEYIETTVASVASGIAWSVVTQTMTGIIQEVGRKSQVFVQLDDPVTTGEEVHEHDFWVKTASVRTWSGLAGSSWGTTEIYKWRELYGAKIFVRKNNAWQEVTDSSTAVEQQVRIETSEDSWAIVGRKIDMKEQEYDSRFQVTAEKISSEVSAAKSNLYSVVFQTATNVFSGVYDKAKDTFSTIEQTSDAIRLGVNASKSDLCSIINITATGVFSGVYDRVEGNFSTIAQTSTNIALAVKSTKDDYESKIEIEKRRINLVVEGTGNSAKVKRASIVASINDDDTSNVYINADKIRLDGKTIAYYLTADYIKTKLLDATGVTLNGVTVNNSAAFNGSLLFKNGTDQYGNTYFNALNALQAVQITGPTNNSYKLQYKRVRDSDWQDAQSFSRAVTGWGYSWSGGQLTVTANPQGNSTKLLGVTTKGSWSGNTYNGRIVYWEGTDDETTYNVPNATFSISRAIEGWGYSWNNGQLTVSVSPQNVSTKLIGVRTAGSWSGNTYNGRIVYWEGTEDDRTWNTGATFSLSDANLVESNVKNGVSIFGVTGNYSGGGSISDDDIQIGSYNNVSTEPSGTTANLMKETIIAAMNNHNWFRFRVYVRGTSAEKYYKFKFN